MSTFQGFNITGIDRNKSPVILDDRICFTQFYLVLDPIDAAPSPEDSTLWEYCFRDVLDNWKDDPDLKPYEVELVEVPQLTFVSPDPLDNEKVFICANGADFNAFYDSITFIMDLVPRANQKFKNGVNGFRAKIDKINADRFEH